MIKHEIDQQIRELYQQQQQQRALELLVESYGPEVGGWLAGVLSHDADTREAYSVFLEDVWRGLEKFRWESSLRTWLYRVARNAAIRVVRKRDKQPLLNDSVASRMPVAPRTETKPWLRTEVKAEFSDLMQSLEPEDRMILILRVDRNMSWEEVASIVHPDDADSPERLRTRSAAIRQRFVRLKRRLRELAIGRGIIAPDDGFE